MDEFRFRSQQSPRNEPNMNTLVSPPRNGTRLPQSVPTHDARNSLPRRFTTESGRVPTLSQITSTSAAPMPPAMSQPPDLAQAQALQNLQKVQLLEKKRLEYERIREQKRRFELEMQKLDQQEKQEEQELAQMTEDLGRLAGHQSEPTTPPEYREPISSGFPTFLSRPNRYSTSSLTSPPGIYNRSGRSGSQLASPQANMLSGRFAFDDQLPTRSFPTTRRNSDDDDKEEAVRQDPTSHRSTNALNRYSMPVTKSRSGFYDLGLDGTGTTRFLFGDDDTGDTKSYGIGNNPTDESFPTLTRRDDYPNMLSASSAALDLALSQPTADESMISNGWGGRHRNQPSLSQTSTAGEATGLGGRPAHFRHSLTAMETYTTQSQNNGENSAQISSPPTNHSLAAPPKLTSSYSASEVHTVKSSSGTGISSANNHAHQHLQNHNANTGRFPSGAVINRANTNEANNIMGPAGSNYHQPIQGTQGGLHPGNSQSVHPPHQAGGHSTNASSMAYSQQQQSYYPGFSGHPNYGMVGVTNGMQNLNVSANHHGIHSNPAYAQYYTQSYQSNSVQAGMRDNQSRVMADRRRQDQDAMARYNAMTMEEISCEIEIMCRDQHGCRFLQRQLESRNSDYIKMVWSHVRQFVVELMVDPFGNYLCQKLLEYCNDRERSALVVAACQDVRGIALNQHGTRALQKMIEQLSSEEQTQQIILALAPHVVELIQDLNGNHVIQKCLNKFTSKEADFIFQAVGQNCIAVGTHRHGCCVLQRCIDHAAGDQKVDLIQKITKEAPELVRDPFGNYVVQYIIDLNEPSFTEPLVHMFKDQIASLSRHKFSSNVVEKCLRCATDLSKDMIVSEMLAEGEIDKMLRDSFANYVVQTALDFATPPMKNNLINTIRPLLPTVRNTPYGRRIAAKIASFDSRTNAAPLTPSEPSIIQASLRQQLQAQQQQQQTPSGTQQQSVGAIGSGMAGGNAVSRGSVPQMTPLPNISGGMNPAYSFGPVHSHGPFNSIQGRTGPKSHQFSGNVPTNISVPVQGSVGNTHGPIGPAPGRGNQQATTQPGAGSTPFQNNYNMSGDSNFI